MPVDKGPILDLFKKQSTLHIRYLQPSDEAPFDSNLPLDTPRKNSVSFRNHPDEKSPKLLNQI